MPEGVQLLSKYLRKTLAMDYGPTSSTKVRAFLILILRCVTGLLRLVGWDWVLEARNGWSTNLVSSPRPARAPTSRLLAGDRIAMISSHRITITEESHVGAARRCVAEICARLNTDEVFCGKVAIVVTEMARNVVR